MTGAVRRTGSAALVAAVVFGGVPTLLVALARARFDAAAPFAGVDAPWRWRASSVRDGLASPLRDGTVVDLVLRLALAIAWVAVIVVLLSTIGEIVHMVRHRGLAVPRIRGLGWAQPLARFIAAGLVASLPVVESSGVVAGVGAGGAATSSRVVSLHERHVPPRAVVPGGATSDPSPALAAARRDAGLDVVLPDPVRASTSSLGIASTPTTSVHVVARGESVWAIAERLGDGDPARTMELAEAILDLNLGEEMADGHRFSNPALIQVGWTLRLPVVHSGNGSFVEGSTVSGEPVSSSPGRANDGVHVVVPGETLSGIAASTLGDAIRWTEIWDVNAGRTMVDGRRFDDPDLILPGWELTLPGDEMLTSDPAAPGDGTVAEVESLPEPEVAAEPLPPPVIPAESEPSTDAGADTDADTTLPRAPTPGDAVPATPPGAPATTVATTDPPAEHVPPERSPSASDAPRAPTPIGWEEAGLVAAGVLTLVAVRRRRRLRAARPRSRIPAPRPETADLERRLRTAAPGECAARIDVAVRAIAASIAETGVRVGSVTVAPDGDLSVRLTGAAALPAPWVGTGADWTLSATTPVELLASAARRSGRPTPALVQIGVEADGSTVLLDLEAAGVTAIEATEEQADAVVRGVALALATSLDAEVAHLIATAIDDDTLLGHPNGHRVDDLDEALELAVSLAGSTLATERSAFDLRTLRTGGEMWEPAVVLASSQADAGVLRTADLPALGQGWAVVIATDPGELAHAGARIVARPGCWSLHAFELETELSPIGVDVDDVDRVVELVDVTAEPCDPEPSLAEPAPAAGVDGVGEPFVPRAHEILVRLLGSVDVVDRDGHPGRFDRSKTVELIAWLATHRDRATRTAARTALWELDVRDATFANVVSEARRGLGRLTPPPEGDEWLARTLNESLPLHELVVTDADLVRDRLDHARLAAPAEAVEVLRPAVEMVRDLPFAGTSYLWPDADGITSDLVLLATTAAAELAAHALALGDVELVFWATGQGLRVLPGHEELIASRMRAHAHAGDLAGVRQEWESYERVVVADAWSDGEPSPKLVRLRRELLAPA